MFLGLWRARQETAQGNLALLCVYKTLYLQESSTSLQNCLIYRSYTFEFQNSLMAFEFTKISHKLCIGVMRFFPLAAALYTCLMYHRS